MARRRQWHLLQYSCLEYPTDGGAWWAAVYGVAQSRTRLKRPSSSSCSTTVPRFRASQFSLFGAPWFGGQEDGLTSTLLSWRTSVMFSWERTLWSPVDWRAEAVGCSPLVSRCLLREMYCKSLLFPSCLNLASGLAFGATDVISLRWIYRHNVFGHGGQREFPWRNFLVPSDLFLFFICKGCISQLLIPLSPE